MFFNWRGKIVDKYIFKEVLKPFAVGVAIIGVIMLSSFLFQLADLIIVKDVPVMLVIRLMLYQLPDIIVQTFPMAVLFATLSGLGRLNRENEFTALRMGGISLYRLILPLFILGVIISGATFLLNEEIVPWSNHQARNIIRRTILKEAMPDIQENVFFKGPEGRLFYIKEYDERTATVEKIVIFNLPAGKNYPEVITANSGQVMERVWKLKSGLIHRYDEQGHLTVETSFDVMDIQLGKDFEKFFGEQKTPAEMSRKELAGEISLFQNSGIRVDSLLVDYHMKLALAFTPLLFVIIGAPLSLGNKDSRTYGIIVTIIIIFLYYLFSSLARSFGRNGMIAPLPAAWMTNILFGLLGVLLITWRESWQNLLKKLSSGLLVFLLVFSVGGLDVQAAEKLTMNAEHVHYDGQTDSIEATGKIRGFYGELNLFAEKVIVKTSDGGEEIFNQAQKIELLKSKMSGCEYDQPHYFFQAKEVTIYPDDHLEARSVTFWELKGKLPLFYWPYLYISLKDKDQRLIPELGYSARRGWFIKTTYNYWYDHRLPGALYLDYYTISGTGIGIKQYFVYEPEQKGSIYYYTQENRTLLPELWKWQGAVDYEDKSGNWQTDTNLQYTLYDNYDYARGSIALKNNQAGQWLKLNTRFDSRDYFETDSFDRKNLYTDFNYTRKIGEGWELNLDYNRDYQLDPDDGLKSRWGSKSYLTKKAKNYSFKFLLERYAPQFSTEGEEEGVVFFRWPEIELKYHPGSDITYTSSLGHYYEDRSAIEGYRLLNELNYHKWWRLTNWLSLQTNQVLRLKNYQTIPPEEESVPVTDTAAEDNRFEQLVYQNQYSLRTAVTRNLTWTNKYNFTGFTGETPFNFDRVNYDEKVKSELAYRKGGFSLGINGGYDIYNLQYLPVQGIINWQLTPQWKLSMGTSYNPNTQLYGDVALTSKYKDQKWEINTALRADPNIGLLERVDNKLVYNLERNWYLELNTRYDLQQNLINEANLLLKKQFHRRALWFTYDHLNREFMVEYHLDLFPDHEVKFGSSDDEPFMFDLGIRDLLGFKN